MPRTNIYIPDQDMELFEAAKREIGDSMSATFIRCLKRELDIKRAQTGRITVKVSENTTKAFDGRWIIGSAEGGEEHSFDGTQGIYGTSPYSVAITRANRIVVVTFDKYNEQADDFEVYDDFDCMSKAEADCLGHPAYPDSLIQAVAAELDIEIVEELDI
ncbi:MAG: hypothetical protein JNL98_21225 [Bryobacterales bacterium]|nr:hypothetical protein [Bryobacterales bacterium]